MVPGAKTGLKRQSLGRKRLLKWISYHFYLLWDWLVGGNKTQHFVSLSRFDRWRRLVALLLLLLLLLVLLPLVVGWFCCCSFFLKQVSIPKRSFLWIQTAILVLLCHNFFTEAAGWVILGLQINILSVQLKFQTNVLLALLWITDSNFQKSVRFFGSVLLMVSEFKSRWKKIICYFTEWSFSQL